MVGSSRTGDRPLSEPMNHYDGRVCVNIYMCHQLSLFANQSRNLVHKHVFTNIGTYLTWHSEFKIPNKIKCSRGEHLGILHYARHSWPRRCNQWWHSSSVSQRAHDAIITSLCHQNDVTTSFWRHNDVIIASCTCPLVWCRYIGCCHY